jgi:uncharacterized protein (DUF302 family)
MLTNTKYGMSTTFSGSYEEAIERITAALKVEGFGILTTIDVKATMKAKLNVDVDKYIILGACNPNLAHRAMQNEKEIGLLLPCNVIVYEANGVTHVAVQDPQSMVNMTENAELCTVADEATERLTRVINTLTQQAS